MATSSWLVGSICGFANQTIETQGIPFDDLVFLASPAITESYPASGTEVTNIAPSSGSEVGDFTGGTTYSGGYFLHDGASGDVEWSAFTNVNDMYAGTGTWLIWVRSDSDGENSQGRLLSKGVENSTGYNFYNGFDNGTLVTPAFRVYTATTDGLWFKSLAGTLGAWELHAWEFDSDNPTTPPKLWINGVEETSLTESITPTGAYVSDAASTLLIGNVQGGLWTHDGPTGLTAGYTRALSDAEHLAFYNATKGDHGGTASLPSTALTYAYDGTYLDHTTAGLSMMGTLDAGLVAAGITGATSTLTQSGHVSITADSAFGIEWTAAGATLRDNLGFAGDLGMAVTHEATLRPPLLWVPRKDETPEKAPLGAVGAELHNATTFVAPDGTAVTRSFGDPLRENRIRWEFILKDQFWTSDEAAGELQDFYNLVLSPGAKFRFFREVTADYTSSTAVSIGTAIGPYVKHSKERALPMRRSAGFEAVECRYDFTIDVLQTTEYGT